MKTVAICVGHSRLRSGWPEGGARSVTGESEWEWNVHLAHEVAEILHDHHQIPALVVDRYEGGSYGAAMSWLGKMLREEGDIALAVELHFNAANGLARGHEWLHWHRSTAGKRLATNLHLAFSQSFPQAVIPARGVKPRSAVDRGALFLQRTHCPAVICEPFFGDNRADWEFANKKRFGIAKAIARGIAASH